MDSAPPAMTTLRAAGADALIGHGDGLEARRAEAIDGGAGNLDRQAGAQSGHAGNVKTLLAFGLGAAQDDVINSRFVEGWNSVQGSANGGCSEVVGAGSGERAFGGAAHGSADGGDEDGFGHEWLQKQRTEDRRHRTGGSGLLAHC